MEFHYESIFWNSVIIKSSPPFSYFFRVLWLYRTRWHMALDITNVMKFIYNWLIFQLFVSDESRKANLNTSILRGAKIRLTSVKLFKLCIFVITKYEATESKHFTSKWIKLFRDTLTQGFSQHFKIINEIIERIIISHASKTATSLCITQHSKYCETNQAGTANRMFQEGGKSVHRNSQPLVGTTSSTNVLSELFSTWP